MTGDPQTMAYAGLGVIAFSACLLAGLTWPFALWRSDSQRFADFLLIALLPLIWLAAYYLGLGYWLERDLLTLVGQRSAYAVLAFMGCASVLGNLTFPWLVEFITVVGAGAAIAWLVRLLRWGVGKAFARDTAGVPADAPTVPQAHWSDEPNAAPAVAGRRGIFADRRRTGLAIATAAVALTGGGWAWNAGYVPGNPRALNKDLIARVLRDSGGQQLQRAQTRGCAAIWQDYKPVGADQQPFEQQVVLPWAFAPLVDEAGGATEKRLVHQLRVLKDAGFFTEEPAEQDATGRRLQRFRLTWDGWRNQENRCFRIGTVELDGIDGMTLRGENPLGYELWEVQARYRVKNPQAWAKSPEARDAFPEIAKLIDGVPAAVTLARTGKGWFADGDMMRMGMGPSAGLQMQALRKLPENFSESQVNDLIRDNRQFKSLCLDLPAPYGLFHRPPGTPFPRARSGEPVPPYGGTVYNNSADKDPRRRDLAAANWKRLEMLAAAGVLDKTIHTTLRDPLVPTALGSITYQLREPFQSALVVAEGQAASGICLRLGGLNVDRLSLERVKDGASMVVKGHASLKDPAPWITDALAGTLPDVDYARRHGVYFTATIAYRGHDSMRGADSEIPQAQVTLVRPRLNYNGIKPPWESNPGLQGLEAAAAVSAALPTAAPLPAGPASAPRPGAQRLVRQ